MTDDKSSESGEPRSRPPSGLPVALTKDEFERRFSDRLQIFSIAMSVDTGDIFSQPLPRDRARLESEILRRIAELVNREISRIVDLVYEETL